MSLHEDRGKEQRRSYRCPVPPTQQEAELRVGRRRVPVRLFNESSGGFAIWAEDDPGLHAGDQAELITSSSAWVVRVAYAETTGAQGTEDEDAKVFRLGLERAEDIAASAEEWRLSGVSRHRRAASGTMQGVVAGLAIALVLLVGVWLLIQWNHPLARRRPGPDAAPAGKPSSTAETPSKGNLSEAAQELGLSKAQENRLREAARSMARAMNDLDAPWQHGDPQERSRKQAMLWEAARRETVAAPNREVVAQGAR